MNRLLDALPRTTVHLGGREVPAFRSLGVLGFHLALLTALLAGVRARVTTGDVLALSTVAAASFFGWGLLRRAVTGRESLVLLEHVWVAIAAVAALRLAAGVPVLPGLDVLTVSLCPFLALGRIGCLTVGCCHGQPAPVGIIYRASAAVPDRLVGVRLFPVPLLEAVALLSIGVIGLTLAAGPPGTATAWVLTAYAVVRFGTEALRGDTRASAAGIGVPRLMCGAQVALVLLVGAVTGAGTPRQLTVDAAVLVVAAGGGLVLNRLRRDPLGTPAHLDEVWARIRALASRAPAEGSVPLTDETSTGVRIAVSVGHNGLHVSLSHPTRPVTALPSALGLSPLLCFSNVTHVLIPAERVPIPACPTQGTGGYDRDRTTPTREGGPDGDYFGVPSET